MQCVRCWCIESVVGWWIVRVSTHELTFLYMRMGVPAYMQVQVLTLTEKKRGRETCHHALQGLCVAIINDIFVVLKLVLVQT